MNGKEVLITKVEKAKRTTPAIVAGRLRGAQKDAASSTSSTSTTSSHTRSTASVAGNSSVGDEQVANQSNRITPLGNKMVGLRNQMENDKREIFTKVGNVECKLTNGTQDLTLSLKEALDRQSKDLCLHLPGS